MAKRAPYERRDDESEVAFEAFKAYRDMGAGERNQVAVASQLGKSTTLIARWGVGHSWVKRCAAYDREVDRREQVGKLKGVEDMRRRQTRIALDLQELGQIELKKMLKQAKKLANAGSIDQPLVMKLIDLGSRLERVNRGQPGEIIQNTNDPVDYSSLTTAELKTMRSVRAKLRQQREQADGKVPDE